MCNEINKIMCAPGSGYENACSPTIGYVSMLYIS